MPAILFQVTNLEFSVSRNVRSEIPLKEHLITRPIDAFAEFQCAVEMVGLGQLANLSS